MFQLILAFLGYVVKNTALLIGILEGLVKFIEGVILFTPTKKDDIVIPKIDAIFSAIKRFLYELSEFMTSI